ncbi:MAG: glutamine--fructose-6-phosphate transaminase (isomerizing) [candidate division KSB1 bacterium]|nr:glutamine--fructose-6-phosphate transaminase (isomerizing) [candidate division KSB1 bacterium]MDZ7274724.1 glutamine--fructose-6-phosphate transaminase (isomerizing) [candidate division KSB1 bacterium]MDZ7285549.1 glutamine--fructose-6-phosphate transaminase (isomerizing) [candidate division KSB1 bacterium]MDZ7298581.1 glutamine--fructose-6-phosphate transaminase (isomerizing) [candidate division KSB1 bacterium]MDZ7306760.1 glutamine--fructose-6-phosphate transaminase (isomerizing) [candidat
MCGIVGYVGEKPLVPLLIEGLKRLEYRGYDSAGLAIVSGNKLVIEKQAGKISNLERRMNGIPLRGSVGIAHTRWATHGVPNDVNAHPHTDSRNCIALIHNGIIENFLVIKRELVKKGHSFCSETDTEVLVHLIEEFLQQGLQFEEAVRAALAQVQGTYGIAVISHEHPDTIIAARRGSPLVIGIGEGEYFVASDATAMVEHTKNVTYLDDGEMAVLTRNGVQIKTIDNQPVTKAIERIAFDIERIEKGGYDHFMMKEIMEQPRTIEDALRGRLLPEEGMARLGGIRHEIDSLLYARRILLTACGTSWHAALIGEYMLEEFVRIPVEVEYASEFRYRDPVLDRDTVVMVISQSGETADTLAALREAKRKGAKVLGICNVVGSTIARETDAGVYLHAGPEIGVASTKAFTSQVTVLSLITLLLARMRNMSASKGRETVQAMQALPRQVEQILQQREQVREIAKIYHQSGNFLYLGRGYNFPVALEGALKLKEISYIHAEGYPAAEMKHGPIALIDENMPVVFIATKDSTYDKIISNIEEVRARRGRVIAIATEGDQEIRRHTDHVIYIPPTIEMLMPILTIIPLQLLAYYIAILRGCDVDQPRNLAKSVTVE